MQCMELMTEYLGRCSQKFVFSFCYCESPWQAQTSRRHYHNATAERGSDRCAVQMTYSCYLTTLTEPSRCCLELNDYTRKIWKGSSMSGRGYHQGVVIQSQRTTEIHEKPSLARLFPGRKSNLQIPRSTHEWQPLAWSHLTIRTVTGLDLRAYVPCYCLAGRGLSRKAVTLKTAS